MTLTELLQLNDRLCSDWSDPFYNANTIDRMAERPGGLMLVISIYPRSQIWTTPAGRAWRRDGELYEAAAKEWKRRGINLNLELKRWAGWSQEDIDNPHDELIVAVVTP